MALLQRDVEAKEEGRQSIKTNRIQVDNKVE